jgi:hypothetical protein
VAQTDSLANRRGRSIPGARHVSTTSRQSQIEWVLLLVFLLLLCLIVYNSL